LLLMLAGAGDELQGIKKGIMEMANIIAITKADGDNKKPAQLARAEFQHALHLTGVSESGWTPTVLTCSALANEGISEIWHELNRFKELQVKSDGFNSLRQQQKAFWLNEQLNITLRQQLTHQASFGERWIESVERLGQNEWTIFQAVDYLIRPIA
jgi:LAO/AO transport system kinase